jgi:hypothetical protein
MVKIAKVLVMGVVMVLVSVVGTAARDKEASAKADAQKAAEAWLAKVDAGKYAESWDEASTLLQQATTKEQWASTLQQLSATLGKMKSRALKAAQYVVNPPGAPAGEYVQLQFDTVFDTKGAAVETVTPVFEGGKWRVAGYYARPPAGTRGQ